MRKTALALTLATAVGLVLSACGGSDETAEAPAPAPTEKPADKTATKTTKTAAATSDNNLPKLKCPAKIKGDYPGPDVIGIKLGMSQADALNIVRCHTKDAAHVSFQPRWLQNLKNHGTELGPQAFEAQHGETSECSYRSFSEMQKCGVGNRVWNHVAEKIIVAAPGLPGRETVVAVWRSQSFKDGEMPAKESVINALTQKYGEIQGRAPDRTSEYLHWGEDSSGNRLPEQHPLYRDCVTNGAHPQGGAVWREGCGINVTARIIYNPQNPDLVKEIHLGMLHQENLWNYGEALQVELDELEQKRRQEELNRAREAGSDIQL